MTEAQRSLIQRVLDFAPGDVLEAAEILETLERVILNEQTNFDEAAVLSRLSEEFTAWVKTSDPLKGTALKTWLAEFGLAEPANAESKGQAERVTQGPVEVDVEVLNSFLTEAREHLESIEARILSLESDPDPKLVNEIFRAVHTIKGVSGFLNLHQIKKLSHELEFLLDELRSHQREVDRSLVDLLLLGSDTLGQLVEHVARAAATIKIEKGTTVLDLQSISLDDVLAAIDLLRSRPSGQGSLPPPKTEAVQTTEIEDKFRQEFLEALEVVERCVLSMEKAGAPGGDLNEAFRSIHTLKGNAGFLGYQALEGLCMEMESFLDTLRQGTRSIDAGAAEILLGYLDRLRGLIQAKPAASSSPGPLSAPGPRAEMEGSAKSSAKKKDIRVDTDKLDQLFDLIGELITAEAMVIDSPDLRGLELENFPRAAAYLSKITRELQGVGMSIRMIPLEGLFGKMNRLVRDLGRKFAKEVQLEISGAETEMDRNIIEEISDPLVHIIRNALDHGIEDDETRRAKGKVPGGRIRLDARYEGNEIWITVGDDGEGLNRERILEVAKSRGLEVGASPSDEEVWRLIFEPGFSTAKEVSEISGRGVGMDVVKRNIEKLRGHIDIQTAPDQGTNFIMKIPLTLAIIDGVTLRSGEGLFSIPIADVVEFQNYQPGSETKTDPEHSVLLLRDEILPVLALSKVFSSRTGNGRPGEKPVSIIVKSQGRKLALVVDEVVGYKQIVLKSLPESMAGLEGISGCTILGNGEVSLIVDINALFTRFFV